MSPFELHPDEDLVPDELDGLEGRDGFQRVEDEGELVDLDELDLPESVFTNP